MAESERRRILDMLASGQINSQEAEELLMAVERPSARGSEEHRRPPQPPRPPGLARTIRITVDNREAPNGNRVAVSVPLALAKFAGKLIPADVRQRLEREGIEVSAMLQALDADLPAGRLLDIDSAAGEGEAGRARIIVEVV